MEKCPVSYQLFYFFPITIMFPRELMNMVRVKMSYITENLPQEITSPNVMRHFLKIIRELYESGSKVSKN